MDAYRDEKETLRRRVEALERELAEAQARAADRGAAHVEETRRLRERIAELERYAGEDGRARLLEELEAVHRELDRLRRRGDSARTALYLTGGAVAVGLSAVLLFLAPGVGIWTLLGLLVAGTIGLATRYSSRVDRARWERIEEEADGAAARVDEGEEEKPARRRTRKVRVATEELEEAPAASKRARARQRAR